MGSNPLKHEKGLNLLKKQWTKRSCGWGYYPAMANGWQGALWTASFIVYVGYCQAVSSKGLPDVPVLCEKQTKKCSTFFPGAFYFSS